MKRAKQDERAGPRNLKEPVDNWEPPKSKISELFGGKLFRGTPDQMRKLHEYAQKHPRFSRRANRPILVHLCVDRASKLDRLVDHRRKKWGHSASSQRKIIEEALDRFFALKFDD